MPVNNPGHSTRDLNLFVSQVTEGCNSVLELGCGYGDKLALCRAPVKIGVDAHLTYVMQAVARFGNQAAFFCAVAENFVQHMLPQSVDAILFIDFIEHLEANAAETLIRRCKEIARKKIAAFVPEGHCPLTEDVFKTGGDYWQTHRSDWTRDWLHNLKFDVAVWENYHVLSYGKRNALLAVWEAI